MLNIKNVSFSYNNQPLLQNICMNCNPGEIHVLLGKNGSGKSTLLQCIAGILHPQKGNIYIDQQDIIKMSPKIIAQRVALVQQTMQYSFSYTVEDMILMGRTSHLNFLGQLTQNDYAIAEESLSLVGMATFKNRSYMELSSGEKQMILLARALCQKPKVLLLDEPNSHLDIPNQLKLLQTITKLSKEKHWITLAVLHTPEIAYWFADTVHLLLHGKIVYSGVPKDILTDKNLSEIYEIPIKTYHFTKNHIAITI